MSTPLEDYALIGDCETTALVSKQGSIDWLCLPRFDSPACFAALLGNEENGYWRIVPRGEIFRVTRRYRPETLILETSFETEEGEAILIDCMLPRDGVAQVIRMVAGKRGVVRFNLELVIRFDYGSFVPWVHRVETGLRATAGPDSLILRTPTPLHGENFRTIAEFEVREKERIPFVLTWFPSHKPPPPPLDPEEAIAQTEQGWHAWSSRCNAKGPYREAVLRSLITLKALTYAPTGGILAAATTSLPERLGGVRNWDYRFCWLRDSTFTLYSLMNAGYIEEAKRWREWLLRAVAGMPAQMQIMYGLSGERRLIEWEPSWLPGYENSSPVRIGNAAHQQFQLDVYGEVMDSLHLARRSGLQSEEADWNLQRALMKFLESAWDKPDEGIWEIRGERRHFTHSKVMAWVAFDRAIKAVEEFQLSGPVEQWRALRSRIHEEICEKGFNSELQSFVQFYGSDELDASLLLIPLVGFLPPSDSRVRSTIQAIEKHLLQEGFVLRYNTASTVDALPSGEGAFLACSFWLADNYILQGRYADARALFERLLSLRNDVGLLSEEYDPTLRRLVGNFPQAFSHVALINTARNLYAHGGPAEDRPKCHSSVSA